uniref:Uncharacterized protein n=1 Tax=Virus NIOZ-UU157 TaxID=2763269 RepID=A0A7S9SUA6_9VIRU|nr:MAG: hypothetical protein NIOZUU157_00058 [Virus NIOZ-UU157]|tara:strand:- start:2957 stop:3322 length:366 start_codon:yes stop_codon:yes gene_type:complete
MAKTLSSTFRLATLTGTDPVTISIAPALSIGDPSGSGSISTTIGSNDTVLSSSNATDSYLFIRNTGASTEGNVLVTTGSSNNVGLLKPQDFLFIPLKSLVGCRVIYDTAVTTLDWFYWTRP